MVDMKPAEAVIAGSESLEHCLIVMSDDGYDVWRLQGRGFQTGTAYHCLDLLV